MRALRLTLLLTFIALVLPFTGTQASQRVAPEAARAAIMEKVKEKYGAEVNTSVVDRLEKKLNKKAAKWMKRLAKKADIDFDDPVDRWLWLWIISWGIAIVLSILGYGVGGLLIRGTLAWLLWLAGTVFFIIWLVKKFS